MKMTDFVHWRIFLVLNCFRFKSVLLSALYKVSIAQRRCEIGIWFAFLKSSTILEYQSMGTKKMQT